MPKSLFFLPVLLLLAALANAATDEVEVKFQFVRHEGNVLAAVFCKLPAPYHTYAHEPGGTGLPTNLRFLLDGQPEPVIYPPGERGTDVFDKSLQVNLYEDSFLILAILPEVAAGRSYAATLDMLLCSDRNCLPFKKEFSGRLPDVIPPLADEAWAEAALSLLATEDERAGELVIEDGVAPPPQVDSAAETRPIVVSAEEIPALQTLVLHPVTADEAGEIYSLGSAILFGLLAGLILNAMPCVLPVLAMKVTVFLQGGDDPERKRKFRQHNAGFAAGILSLFLFLALVLGAADLMWGQLYQYPGVIIAMLLLVFLMGLSMLGVFDLPVLDLRAGSGSGFLDSYLTGLAATFLATPCSGPLLGGVLAWAFGQPLLILVIVFLAVGSGMAVPYLLFAFWPDLARFLPRPGAWMLTMERVLGFLLLGTALYLLSILPEGNRLHILALLLAVALGTWFWGRFCGLGASRLRRSIFATLGIILMISGSVWALQPVRHEVDWLPFTPATFMDSLGEKNFLVEFTADWCPNCKFLESTVLGKKEFQQLQQEYNLELIRVDLTSPEPQAQHLLEMLGSKSIPLTAIFPAGARADRPTILRDIYTMATLASALEKSLGK